MPPYSISGYKGALYFLKVSKIALQLETAEKEEQDTSCWGSGGVPQLKKVPQDWGIRGLIKTISAFSDGC
jgi:hypothetical protein